MKKITMFALALLFGATTPHFISANTTNPTFQSVREANPDGADGFIIEYIVTGLHQLSWSPMAGSTPYTVTVVNLNTNGLFTQFTTSGTSTLVYGLTTGETYLFTVRRGNAVQSLEATI